MSRETRKTQIIHLLANPALTHETIAKTVGCSTKTVQRVAKDIKPDVEEVEAKVGEYRRLLSKHATIPDRVKTISEVMHGENEFARLAAVKRADQIDGIEARIAPKETEKPAPETRPMFNLPPGTMVAFKIPEVIDLTPDKQEPHE